MRRRLGWVGLLTVASLLSGVGLWAGTGGNQAFIDSTGKLLPMVEGVPLILALRHHCNIILQTTSGSRDLSGPGSRHVAADHTPGSLCPDTRDGGRRA